MALPNITTKIINSDDYNERKILASDVNKIKQAIQTGVLDIKPSDIHMEGNVITADGGQNWIRRSGNKFQYYDAGTWKEITDATNTATFTAGENIAIRDVVYLNVSDGKIYKASNTNYDWIGVAKKAITKASTGEVYLNNSVIGGFTGLTRGAWYGLSNTAGSITKNKKEVGIAISSTQLIIIKNNTTELNNLYKLDSEKAINDVSVTNSGILASSSQVLIDKFLDSTGQNNTVDTGNTTAYYNSELLSYTCKNENTAITNASFADGDPPNNWTYVETDADFLFRREIKGTGYCAYIGTNAESSLTGYSYCQISQDIDFTNVKSLEFTTDEYVNSNINYRFQLIIDGVTLVDHPILVGLESYNYNIDCINITGVKTLTFKLYADSASNSRHTFIRIYNLVARGYNYVSSQLKSVATVTKYPITTETYQSSGATYVPFYYSGVGTKLIGVYAKLKTDSGGGCICYLKTTFTYSDDTTADVEVSVIGYNVTAYRTATNPEPAKVVRSVLFYIKNTGGNAFSHQISEISLIPQINASRVYITGALLGDIPEGDGITADISLDGGATYTTGLLLNKWYNISSSQVYSIITVFNLNTADGSTTPKVSGWRVLLE